MKSKLAGFSLIGMAVALLLGFAVFGNTEDATAALTKSVSADSLVVLAGNEMIEDKIEALEDKIDELEELKDFDEEDMMMFVGDFRDKFDEKFDEEDDEREFDGFDDDFLHLFLLGLLH